MSVFSEKGTVFFASDDAEDTSDLNCGCTLAWWNTECPNHTEAEHLAAAEKLINGGLDGGEPLFAVSGVEYDSSESEFVLTGCQAAGLEVGMLVNIYYDEYGAITPDIYEVTYVDTNHFKCDDLEWQEAEEDALVDIRIGGVLPLQDALDETSALTHSVLIYVMDVDQLSASLDIDMGGGNNIRNTFKQIVGFKVSPGDINIGGTYYESPEEILRNGSIDANKTVLLDANDGAFEPIDIGADNIIIENLHLSNNDENLAAILFSNTPQNIVFRNCRFSAVKYVIKSVADSVLVDSCLAMDLAWNHYSVRGANNVILNCISSNISADAGGADFVVVVNVDGTQVIGCIAVNGAKGIRVVGGTIVAINNTFYNQTAYGIRVENAEAGIAYNNIFALAPGAVGLHVITSGSFIYNDYNCFIESDGTPLTVGIHSSGGEAPVIGPHSLAVDPLFVDAANYDFRLANDSPCIDAGQPDSLDGWSTIGAYDYSANRGLSKSRVIGGV